MTTATKTTTCSDCGETIDPGEAIVPRPHRAWAHEFCPGEVADGALW